MTRQPLRNETDPIISSKHHPASAQSDTAELRAAAQELMQAVSDIKTATAAQGAEPDQTTNGEEMEQTEEPRPPTLLEKAQQSRALREHMTISQLVTVHLDSQRFRRCVYASVYRRRQLAAMDATASERLREDPESAQFDPEPAESVGRALAGPPLPPLVGNSPSDASPDEGDEEHLLNAADRRPRYWNMAGSEDDEEVTTEEEMMQNTTTDPRARLIA